MARLTAEQWIAARADYEIAGLSQADIVRKYGVTRGAVSQRVSAEGWQAGKTKQIIDKKTNAIIALAEAEHETKQTKLNTVERAVFDVVVADDVAFKLQNDADMDEVRKHAMSLLPTIERTSDAKALMETLRIQREARLGKSPETAIQINNNTQAELDATDAASKVAGLMAIASQRRDASRD